MTLFNDVFYSFAHYILIMTHRRVYIETHWDTPISPVPFERSLAREKFPVNLTETSDPHREVPGTAEILVNSFSHHQ